MATNVPGALGGKNRSPESLTFGAVHQLVFPAAPTVAPDASIDTVQSAITLPNMSKVLRASMSAETATESPRIQIVLSSVAPTGVGNTMEIASPGTQILTTPATVAAGGYQGYTVPAANMDVLFPSGSVLTLRVETGAASGASLLNVALDVITVDEHPTSTQPFGPQSF